MPKAKPERRLDAETFKGSVKPLMLREDVWGKLQSAADRVGMTPDEFLSACLIFGIEKPWSVVEGLRDDGSD